MSDIDEMLRGKPLLQLPTGSAKVYTRLDLEAGRVWKGPYRQTALAKVIFFHRVMRDLLHDVHTLNLEVNGKYVYFPLFRSTEGCVNITLRDYADRIAKKDVKSGQFVLRTDLGVIQMHKIPVEKIKDVPMTLWAHFLFRFALNIGDSGLYNAITDESMSVIYGIDMEEIRGSVRSPDLLSYMFTKLPRKEICVAITISIRNRKNDLLFLMDRSFNMGRFELLATASGADFDRYLFEENVKKAIKCVQTL